jgi:hypothetical protein
MLWRIRQRAETESDQLENHSNTRSRRTVLRSNLNQELKRQP